MLPAVVPQFAKLLLCILLCLLKLMDFFKKIFIMLCNTLKIYRKVKKSLLHNSISKSFQWASEPPVIFFLMTRVTCFEYLIY